MFTSQRSALLSGLRLPEGQAGTGWELSKQCPPPPDNNNVFDVLLTVRLGIILVINQLNAQNLIL